MKFDLFIPNPSGGSGGYKEREVYYQNGEALT